MELTLSAYVTDTNIWIDLHCGGLVSFVLEHFPGLCATDIVLRELKRELSADHLIDGGVREIELSGEQVSELYALASAHPRLSAQDASALVAARAGGDVLITGDGHLRKIAESLGVEVHGSLWILEHLVEAHELDPALALGALAAMLSGGSRFPEIEVTALRRRLKGG